MKRYLHNKKVVTQYTEEFNVEITFFRNIESSSDVVLDPENPEYASFVESMVVNFMLCGYELSNNPEWTHKSNKGSESWYYTFLKVINNVEIKVVVNVRVSTHSAPNRPYRTQEELRSKYVQKLGREVADRYNQERQPYADSINVIVDGKHLKSLHSAAFYIKRELESIEEAVAEMEQD